jgi:hypothetical protein
MYANIGAVLDGVGEGRMRSPLLCQDPTSISQFCQAFGYSKSLRINKLIQSLIVYVYPMKSLIA